MREEKTFLGQVATLLFALLAGVLLAWLLTLFVAIASSSFDVQVALSSINRLLQNTDLLRLTQVIQALCLFVLPPFLVCVINHEKPSQSLSFKRPSAFQLMVGAISLVAAIPLINVLVTWNESLHLPRSLHHIEAWMRASELTASELTARMMGGTGFDDLAINLLIVAVLAGFGEELFFRGLLQGMVARFLGRKSRRRTGNQPNWVAHASIWCVALLFSAIHLQFFGFFPRLLLGAWFGYLLWWTGSIWVPIAAHFTNNALTTVFVFAESNGWISNDPDQLGLKDTWWTVIVSLVVLTACAVLLNRKRDVV